MKFEPYANLRGADLRGTNLSRADLRGTNLSRADLRGADLCGTDLSRAKGFKLLNVQDPRGYSFAHASEQLDGTWRIRVGCRDFTVSEALEHWHPKTYRGDPDILLSYRQAVLEFRRWLKGTAG